MRRNLMVAASLLLMILLGVPPGPAAIAKDANCSVAPCDSSVGGSAVYQPVVVHGDPDGEPVPTGSGVFDRGSSGTVAPLAIAVTGLAAMAIALGLTVRHRREAHPTASAAPVARLEPAQEP